MLSTYVSVGLLFLLLPQVETRHTVLCDYDKTSQSIPVTVMTDRRPNAELRTREYLTPDEVESLIEAVKANRHGRRDSTMVLVADRKQWRRTWYPKGLVIGVLRTRFVQMRVVRVLPTSEVEHPNLLWRTKPPRLPAGLIRI
jgi:hypothetical protein